MRVTRKRFQTANFGCFCDLTSYWRQFLHRAQTSSHSKIGNCAIKATLLIPNAKTNWSQQKLEKLIPWERTYSTSEPNRTFLWHSCWTKYKTFQRRHIKVLREAAVFLQRFQQASFIEFAAVFLTVFTVSIAFSNLLVIRYWRQSHELFRKNLGGGNHVLWTDPSQDARHSPGSVPIET